MNKSIIENPATQNIPSVKDLFIGFLFLGLTGFGGVLALTHRMVVEKRKWLTNEEFMELLSLCQFLPGGNVINFSVAIGLKFQGIRGAFASLLGLLGAPSAIVIGLGIIYAHFKNPMMQHMFSGLAAAAAGLLIATAIKMAMPIRKKTLSLMIAAVCFIATVVLGFPLLLIMLVLAPISIFIAWKMKC